MSHVFRKLDFYIYTKMRQRLWFRYTDSTIAILPDRNFNPLTIFCSCIAWSVLGMVEYHDDRICPDVAHIILSDLSCFHAC